jgi:dTDP-4-amino-4,6-dideoxygalactose transaminase
VIEDAAQALLSKYKNRFLGTLGHMGTLSFHETKNIISGEGGALLLNDERFVERAEIIWEKGSNRKKFFRGEVDKYTWVDLGSSFLPSEIIGAFLHAQLQMAETIIKVRRHLFDLYYSLLEPLRLKGKIGLPWVENSRECACPSNGHIFYIVTASLEERTALIKDLKQNGFHAVFNYIPLHSSPAGKRFGRTSGELDFTNNLSDRVLRFPLFFEMKDEEVHHVVNTINHFYKNR